MKSWRKFFYLQKRKLQSRFEFYSIENCVQLSYECPLKWENLTQIEDDQRARFCDKCQQKVHLVYNENDFEAHAEQNHCVAIFLLDGLNSDRSEMLLGMI